jgi:hypothetical protein
MDVMHQFAVESFLPDGALRSAPLGVHGLDQIEELRIVCPEVALIERGRAIKTFKQDLSSGTRRKGALAGKRPLVLSRRGRRKVRRRSRSKRRRRRHEAPQTSRRI